MSTTTNTFVCPKCKKPFCLNFWPPTVCQYEACGAHLEPMLSEEQKTTLQDVLKLYRETPGSWDHTSIVFGYIIGLGFSPYVANRMQGELKDARFFGR